MRPLILISNDDGIHAAGLIALAEAVGDIGDVLVVAPERERSAVSQSITLHKPLRTNEVAPGRFAVSGSPVDCVYLALAHLAPRTPDLVISGINGGYNLGSDVFYSGTVGAACEGALKGIPAIAVSRGLAERENYALAARFAATLGAALLRRPPPDRTVLNVNVPPGAGERYRWTRLGARVYHDVVETRADPRGKPYDWIGGPVVRTEQPSDSDCFAVEHQLISITPLALDLTAYDLLAEPPPWAVDGFRLDAPA